MTNREGRGELLKEEKVVARERLLEIVSWWGGVPFKVEADESEMGRQAQKESQNPRAMDGEESVNLQSVQ